MPQRWLPSQANTRELMMMALDFPKSCPWQSLHPSSRPGPRWEMDGAEEAVLPAQVRSLHGGGPVRGHAAPAGPGPWRRLGNGIDRFWAPW